MLPALLSADTLSVRAPCHESARSLREAELCAAAAAAQDTLPPPRRRPRAPIVEYSEAYGTRVTWHRRLSYPIVPLFAAQWYLGERLMQNQRGPEWIGVSHRAVATATAGIYTFNTVTGLWNLWEGRKDPSGRVRKWLHAAAFVVADAGFVYGASLADEAENGGVDRRRQHRTVELASIGVSVASWAAMLFLKD
jgi:hypothetical protein